MKKIMVKCKHMQQLQLVLTKETQLLVYYVWETVIDSLLIKLITTSTSYSLKILKALILKDFRLFA